MAKKKTNWFNLLWMTVMGVALIGIGSLFVGGSFLNEIILKWLPQIVHTIVGYVIIIGGVATIGVPIWEQFK